jgi:hypothetical protein
MSAPKGNNNAAKAKEWRDALMWALENYKGCEKGKALRLIGEKLIEMAMAGDIQAIKEVADRVDGKPAQTIHADLTHFHEASDLSDAALENIATGSSKGASKAKTSTTKVH